MIQMIQRHLVDLKQTLGPDVWRNLDVAGKNLPHLIRDISLKFDISLVTVSTLKVPEIDQLLLKVLMLKDTCYLFGRENYDLNQ